MVRMNPESTSAIEPRTPLQLAVDQVASLFLGIWHNLFFIPGRAWENQNTEEARQCPYPGSPHELRFKVIPKLTCITSRNFRSISWAWCLKIAMMTGQAKTLSILCRPFHQTAWKRWIIYSFSSRRLFELRMMKILKVSKTDIAGKTLLQWLVEYDADVHIKILLDAGYSIFQKLTKHKTKVQFSAIGVKLNINNLPQCHPPHLWNNMNLRNRLS